MLYFGSGIESKDLLTSSNKVKLNKAIHIWNAKINPSKPCILHNAGNQCLLVERPFTCKFEPCLQDDSRVLHHGY